jgi:type III pantothenate kinase
LNLIIDIGNSRTKVAVYDGNKLVILEVMPKLGIRKLSKMIATYPIEGIILTNTGKVDATLLAKLESFSHFIYLSSETPIPLINKYETPHTLGKDRIAAAVGTVNLFPGQGNLVIDMGTCITLDYIDNEGAFLGGNISPGIQMRLQAMHRFTAKLPLVQMEYNHDLFARNTKNAIQNGAVKGTFSEIDSFIEEVRSKYGSINVILTGGDANYFEKFTKNKIFVSPNLVLEGLNLILKYNAH